MIRRLSVSAAIIAVVACASGAPAQTTFVRSIPWHATGQWIRADLHMHTKFSDGDQEPAALAARAREFGCDAIAIADHSDHNLRAATPEYAAAIADIRRLYPQLVTIAGIEWNVPPSAGNEHATVLVPPGPAELSTLAEFKTRFDDYKRTDHDSLTPEAALKWLEQTSRGWPVAPVVVYNHPSRRDTNSLDNIKDIQRWRAVNDLVIGFEGAPGHQGLPAIGGYTRTLRTDDRWDPVARVGDAWDTLLSQGADVSGAIANSDFHSEHGPDFLDPWPCQFSETRLFVPDRSAAGVLRALRAGALYAGHGRILSSLSLSVSADGLSRPAMIGESIRLGAGNAATVDIALEAAPTDWQGRANRITAVDLVSVTTDGAQVMRSWKDAEVQRRLSTSVTVPPGGIVLRVRAMRRDAGDAPALMYQTNPIRVVTK